MSASSDNRPAPLRLVPSGPRSDAALCRDFLVGDSAAFGELVRRHQDLVVRLLRRYTRSEHESFDLAQRAFLQAFEAARRALPRLMRDDGEVPFKAWLLRIVINLAKNHARAASRWPTGRLGLLQSELPPQPPSAPESMIRAQAQALARQAVTRLPKRQREVLTLRIDGELPFAEIATVLGISEGNAKTHFHYAVKRLRDEIAKLAPEALEET